MRPSNEFTNEGQRFFYPGNNEVEHHESVDTTEFPTVIFIEGESQFVITEKAGVEKACNPNSYSNRSNISEGSVIKQVAGLAQGANQWRLRDVIEGRKLSVIDRSRSSYVPQEGEQVVVKLNQQRMWSVPDNANLPEDDIFILDHSQPMPTAAELGLGESEKAYYEFVGFINTEDKLILPGHSSRSHLSWLVDLCITNSLAQNSLERSLLIHALPRKPMTVELKDNFGIAAYLKYFDATHGTNYLLQTDPKYDPSRFAELTDEQWDRYFFLSRVVERFFNKQGRQRSSH